ncbi:MAG TPA: CoA transferase [Mycobacteriales bacterium]|nr:CoA transferase [Mycobacteriales bacterium]
MSRYRVLDLADARGLLAGRMLADLGADVVLVEPPDGSPARRHPPLVGAGVAQRSAYWEALAANRRGIVADLTAPAGRDRLRSLARHADVLIDSRGPGVLDAAGLSYEQLRELNPALVHVTITAFGRSGPKRDYAETDLVVWAAGGPLDPNRDGDLPPVRISADQAYLHAGADAAAGALMALTARRRTGRGQHVDVSAQASLGVATLGRILAAAAGDEAPEWEPKVAIDQSGSGAGTRRSKWEVRDGLVELHLAMGPAAGSFTNAFFAWMKEEGELPEDLAAWDWRALPAQLRSGERTPADLDRVRTLVAAFLAGRTKDEVTAAALRRRLLCVGISDPADLATSPHLAERGFFVEVGEGERRVRLPGPFARMPAGAFAHTRPAPLLGEHDDEVDGEWLRATLAGASS